MRAAVSVWKKSATEIRKLVRKLPIREHSAAKLRKSAQTPKKRPMRINANMKRVK